MLIVTEKYINKVGKVQPTILNRSWCCQTMPLIQAMSSKLLKLSYKKTKISLKFSKRKRKTTTTTTNTLTNTKIKKRKKNRFTAVGGGSVEDPWQRTRFFFFF